MILENILTIKLYESISLAKAYLFFRLVNGSCQLTIGFTHLTCNLG